MKSAAMSTVLFEPSVSVIVNTDARADSLQRTLDSLRWLDYPFFEVCVVYGPTADGTKGLLEQRRGQVKIEHCPTRNLSASRNIGVAMAAGEIVAFLDDDSIPEPEWLSKIVSAFAQPDVGACGGFLHDRTGVGYQWRFGTVDRLGVPNQSWERPPNEFNFPYTAQFPHVMANSAFRKSAVLAIGGFDEQYEYYLDETDLICRLVDHGWRVVPIAGAAVHHKFLPSHIRIEGAIIGWAQIVKSKIYFSLVNSHGHHGLSQALKGALESVEKYSANLEWGINEGKVSEADRDRFHFEVDRGLQDGLEAGLACARRFAPQQLERFARPFHPFPVIMPAGGRRTLCLLSKTYPPASIGGIGRYIHQLSRAVSRLGHQIHVLTRGIEGDSVNFEDGVWVHRICPKAHSAATVQGIAVPQHIWDYSATMLTEVRRIAESRKVEAVIAPIWDCEGIAFLVDGSFELVTGLHTPFQQWLQTTGNRPYDSAFTESFILPMLALERLLFEQSDGILADSSGIISDIESAYQLRFDQAKLGLVCHGLEDWSVQQATEPKQLPPGALRVLFVGRLEMRKGIDVLLQVAKAILPVCPQVHFDIVGDATLPGPNNLTFRAVFDADPEADAVRSRVHFHGEVSETALRGFYKTCDVFVAPSRFESFGLILLEAMMFAKPVIGCRAGGMTEIIEDGITGLLAEPGNVESLSRCLCQLLADPGLRVRLGEAARRRYLECFTAEMMASGTLEFVNRLSGKAVKEARDPVGAAPIREHPKRDQERLPGPRLPHRIVIINSILARNDAISAAVRDMFYLLSADSRFDVSMFAARNDFPEVPCHIVRDSAQLLLDADYRAADLLIWHFGVCYESFNALLIGNGGARRVVVFHNVTPKEYVSEAQVPLIERSLRQSYNMRYADEVWNDSEANAEMARKIGIPEQRLRVIPLCVDAPPMSVLRRKDSTTLDMLFVGRFVKSKGVLDLIEAVADLSRQKLPPFRLTLAGNLEFSDPLYIGSVRSKIASCGLSSHVSLLGNVDEVTWARLYRRAQLLVIPSYHEGFCKPIIEGLRAGCIPVGYASANLPVVAAGFGRMVPPGSIGALKAALTELLREIPEALKDPTQPLLTLDRGRLSVCEFDAASRDYVASFTRECIGAQLRERVCALLGMDEKPASAKRPDLEAVAP
ncbi:MAG TPA: glycosyltransferase [Candidatus Binataceae bacterium]|nr:glycosyltransferase [Candidatus Binataceae bacterium]